MSRTKTFLSEMWDKMGRKKHINTQTDILETQLRRCLTTFDIVLLGIGHMVGSGAYVLTSSVARNIAGPAIIISFIISGVASFLSALSYAEFAGRFPKCGSAYSYSYLALGELWSFIVGWNMILENVIGTAAVSRACSAYMDSLLNGQIRNYTMASLSSSIGLNYFSAHVDIFAFLIVIVLMVFMTSGVKITSYLNNLFSMINITVIFVIIVVGLYYSDLNNWTHSPNGFMPYGWRGVFAGSATCFYAYIGFDSISSSGEEAKHPLQSIPLATFISMTFATFSYVSVSAVLTLMVPYNQINAESGLPDAFGVHGAVWVKLIVIVGASCGMVTVLIGTMFSLTRIVYSMCDDGLLFSWMGSVNQRTQIPLKAMYLFASMGALMALFIEITTLIEMMSIGTLIAYLVVSASVIVIRYEPSVQSNDRHNSLSTEVNQELNDLSSNISEENKLIDELVNNDNDIQKQEYLPTGQTYAVPFVPLVPTLSIFFNIGLMINLQSLTWLRLIFWMIIGLFVYFCYGINHSKTESNFKQMQSINSEGVRKWGSVDENGISVVLVLFAYIVLSSADHIIAAHVSVTANCDQYLSSMAVPYLDHFLDSLETLPTDLQRNFTLMRDLDTKTEGNLFLNVLNVSSNSELVSKINKSSEDYIVSVNELSTEDKCNRFDHIHDMFEKAKVLSDDKVQLAMQTYEMVDKHIRRLDTELTKFDNDLKDTQLTIQSAEPVTHTAEDGKKKGRRSDKTKSTGFNPKNVIKTESEKGKKKQEMKMSESSVLANSSVASVLPALMANSDIGLDMAVDPNEPTYCLCHQVSYGEMIGCDNLDCTTFFFCNELKAN
ncbi:unnamed protein product [Medioppia subpectinata]|uniref:Inhibitor of growth protein N-terminal histone-binding domain-containing protein n=1 Tax=Medioppia subpectinata TaxID=1979941 RepID=A0A7R9PWS0_9ACAR|nr:unnamed protein product [Medioppia subpectinata]CAG2104226.1 unnamed protein product [Medioppia subpectinata]